MNIAFACTGAEPEWFNEEVSTSDMIVLQGFDGHQEKIEKREKEKKKKEKKTSAMKKV